MAGGNVEFTATLRDRVSGPVRRIGSSLRDMKAHVQGVRTDAVTRLGGAFSQLQALAGRASLVLGPIVSTIGKVALAAGAAAAAVTAAGVAIGAAFLKTTISAASFRQSTVLAFEAILGKGKGKGAFKQASDLAEEFGASIQDTAETMKKMRAAGFGESTSVELFKRFQDLKAVGANAEMLARAQLAITQIQATGKLQGDELMQLGDAGLGAGRVYAALGKQLGKTREEVIALQGAGKISAEVAIKGIMAAIGGMTGGKAAGVAGKKAVDETLAGSLGALKNQWSNMFMTIGKGVDLTPIQNIVKSLRNVFKSDTFKAIKDTLASITNSVIEMGATLASVFGPDITKAFETIFNAENLATVKKAFADMGAALKLVGPLFKEFKKGFKDAFDAKTLKASMKIFEAIFGTIGDAEKEGGITALSAAFRALGAAIALTINVGAAMAAGIAVMAAPFMMFTTAVLGLVDAISKLAAEFVALKKAQPTLGGLSGVSGGGVQTDILAPRGVGVGAGGVGAAVGAGGGAAAFDPAALATAIGTAQPVEKKDVKNTVGINVNVSGPDSGQIAAQIRAQIEPLLGLLGGG